MQGLFAGARQILRVLDAERESTCIEPLASGRHEAWSIVALCSGSGMTRQQRLIFDPESLQNHRWFVSQRGLLTHAQSVREGDQRELGPTCLPLVALDHSQCRHQQSLSL